MSTRATIKFIDGDGDEFYIYRHCDGFPEIIMPDITGVLKKSAGRWSGSEMGMLVSMFLGEMYNPKTRLQNYEMTHSFHGDESYKYTVRYFEGSGWSVFQEDN